MTALVNKKLTRLLLYAILGILAATYHSFSPTVSAAKPCLVRPTNCPNCSMVECKDNGICTYTGCPGGGTCTGESCSNGEIDG